MSTLAKAGKPPADVASAPEPWEWDGDCTKCHSLLDWRGDLPETPEEAMCHECMIETLRAELAGARAAEREAIVAFLRREAGIFRKAKVSEVRYAAVAYEAAATNITNGFHHAPATAPRSSCGPSRRKKTR